MYLRYPVQLGNLDMLMALEILGQGASVSKQCREILGQNLGFGGGG